MKGATPYQPTTSLRDLLAAAYLAALVDRPPLAGVPVPERATGRGTGPLRAKR